MAASIPAGEGTGTNPSPAGRRLECCVHPGCFSREYRSDLCEQHHAEYTENDARQIFLLLWRAIGNWHLQGKTV